MKGIAWTWNNNTDWDGLCNLRWKAWHSAHVRLRVLGLWGLGCNLWAFKSLYPTLDHQDPPKTANGLLPSSNWLNHPDKHSFIWFNLIHLQSFAPFPSLGRKSVGTPESFVEEFVPNESTAQRGLNAKASPNSKSLNAYDTQNETQSCRYRLW